MAALAWLLGSDLGRKVALAGLVAALAGLFILRVYSAGKSAEKARQVAASLENLRTRIKTDDEVSRLSADERRRRLSSWVSD